MSDFQKFLLKAFVRKALTVLATWLMAHGLSSIAPNEFADTYADEIVGWLMLSGVGVWTFVYQKYVKNKVTTALELPKGSTPEQLEQAVSEKSS